MFAAYDAKTGAQLWSYAFVRRERAPISYAVNGTQYIAVAAAAISR